MKRFKSFISFEGIDFSGKTTQITRLLARLQEINFDVHILREPGGTEISEKIRKLLLDPAFHMMHARTEILLYSAARAQLVHQKLLPLLQDGKYVIADRFHDSTTAYQGYGRNLDIRFVTQLNRFATSGLTPYKTFLIDISPEEAYRRHRNAQRSKDRLESEKISFYHAIREGFQRLCRQFPKRFIIINGERAEDVIADEIWEHLRTIWHLNEKNVT